MKQASVTDTNSLVITESILINQPAMNMLSTLYEPLVLNQGNSVRVNHVDVRQGSQGASAFIHPH